MRVSCTFPRYSELFIESRRFLLTPHAFGAPHWRWRHSNFTKMFVIRIHLWAIGWRCLRDPKYSRISTNLSRSRQTQTHDDSIGLSRDQSSRGNKNRHQIEIHVYLLFPAQLSRIVGNSSSKSEASKQCNVWTSNVMQLLYTMFVLLGPTVVFKDEE